MAIPAKMKSLLTLPLRAAHVLKWEKSILLPLRIAQGAMAFVVLGTSSYGMDLPETNTQRSGD